MKCMHCGADLPEDQLICPSCGREIQIVPDYNPLDDMLTAQLKGGITQTMSLHLGEQEKQDVSYSGAANPVYERRKCWRRDQVRGKFGKCWSSPAGNCDQAWKRCGGQTQ